jgi:hypothetical protein
VLPPFDEASASRPDRRAVPPITLCEPQDAADFRKFASLAALHALAIVGAAYAQPVTCVLLHGGCGSPVQPQQCFPDAAGPSAWTDPGVAHTRQIRYAVQSSESTCHGPVGVGAPPACCTSLHPPGAPGADH